MGKLYRTTKILNVARRRGRVAARGAPTWRPAGRLGSCLTNTRPELRAWRHLLAQLHAAIASIAEPKNSRMTHRTTQSTSLGRKQALSLVKGPLREARSTFPCQPRGARPQARTPGWGRGGGRHELATGVAAEWPRNISFDMLCCLL
jgi:hypothetical protein